MDRPRVPRERFLEKGHDGSAGRIDFVIEFKGGAVGIEVKKVGADAADTGKQSGYRESLEVQYRSELLECILLAASGQHGSYSGFRLVEWRTLALNLRRISHSLVARRAERPDGFGKPGQALLRASLILAFCGAVERNLLGFRWHGHLVLGSEGGVISYLTEVTGAATEGELDDF
jgi:hypothetical protein